MKKNIYEIFEEVQKSDDPAKTLKENNNPLVQLMLKLNYCYSEEFDLPEGDPPYKTDKMLPIGYSDSNLYSEMGRLYVCYKSKDIARSRKEQLFIHKLEGIHWTEAKVLCLVKDRKLTELFPKLTIELVKEVYPELITKEKSDEVIEPKKAVPSSENSLEEPKPKKVDGRATRINKGGRPVGSKNKPKNPQ